MKQLTFFDKLKILFDMIFSSSFFFIVLAFMILFIALFIILNKNNVKYKNKIFIGMYAFVLIFILIKYGTSILNMLDNLVDNIFSTIYFPSLPFYIIVLVTSNIILIFTFIKKNVSYLVKIINISCYIFIHFLFIIILETIIKNNVDVYSKLEVYTNTNLLAAIELSTITFALWIITLGVIWLIHKLQAKANVKSTEQKEIKKDSKQNNDDKVSSNKLDTKKIEDRKVPDNKLENKQELQNSKQTIPQTQKVEVKVDKDEPKNNEAKTSQPTKRFINKRDDKFLDSLNAQFDDKISSDDLDIKQKIEEILNKDIINLFDYRRLKNLMDEAKKNNLLTEDELKKLIERVSDK